MANKKVMKKRVKTTVYLEESEYDKLQLLTTSLGMSISSWFRGVIKKALKDMSNDKSKQKKLDHKPESISNLIKKDEPITRPGIKVAIPNK